MALVETPVERGENSPVIRNGVESFTIWLGALILGQTSATTRSSRAMSGNGARLGRL